MRESATTSAAPSTHDGEELVIDLGDAATLTRGSDQQSTENKQEPYD
ncbi:albusnodin family lasso peptide [Streptomyces sp. TS71-3]|nr:albusnodin family lasso peptide [Streptomyces sp. TS71-3]GHJ34469.1 hypothetical protein Sm713_00780 [Streptomyces sp. TS71-3]